MLTDPEQLQTPPHAYHAMTLSLSSFSTSNLAAEIQPANAPPPSPK